MKTLEEINTQLENCLNFWGKPDNYRPTAMLVVGLMPQIKHVMGNNQDADSVDNLRRLVSLCIKNVRADDSILKNQLKRISLELL